MKNTDFRIKICSKSGKWHGYFRDKYGWHQVRPGAARSCTAEQVLNYLLSAFFEADRGTGVQITVPKEKLDGRLSTGRHKG
jgi:hypothetical protein